MTKPWAFTLAGARCSGGWLPRPSRSEACTHSWQPRTVQAWVRFPHGVLDQRHGVSGKGGDPCGVIPTGRCLSWQRRASAPTWRTPSEGPTCGPATSQGHIVACCTRGRAITRAASMAGSTPASEATACRPAGWRYGRPAAVVPLVGQLARGVGTGGPVRERGRPGVRQVRLVQREPDLGAPRRRPYPPAGLERRQ